MSRLPLLAGPAWPPPLSAYDHMSTYAKPDWAWEGLRRNPHYQADAAVTQPVDHILTQLPNGVHITRILSASRPSTGAWSVYPFC